MIMIDQTQLVHDVLSLREDFQLQGAEDALAYRWLLVTGSDAVQAGPLAKWCDQVWRGVALAG
jgi:hypothetical protein